MDKDVLTAKMNAFRESLKGLVTDAVITRNDIHGSLDIEVGNNIELAVRHLEDAAMRFGKAIQACSGGVSPLGGPNTPGQESSAGGMGLRT